MLIREVSLKTDISRFYRPSHLVYIASFCYNYSAEKWEEIVLTRNYRLDYTKAPDGMRQPVDCKTEEKFSQLG